MNYRNTKGINDVFTSFDIFILDIRVGPETVSDPAYLVTRNMEDFVTWVDTSKIKRKIMKYNDKVRFSGTRTGRMDNNDPCGTLICHKLLTNIPFLSLYIVGRLRSSVKLSSQHCVHYLFPLGAAIKPLASASNRDPERLRDAIESCPEILTGEMEGDFVRVLVCAAHGVLFKKEIRRA